jgi:hypothetical protein
MREIRQSGSVRGVRSNPYPYRDLDVLRPPVRSGPKGLEFSLAGGRNCNRPYGSRDAQAKSVSGSTPPGHALFSPRLCSLGFWR